jgi:hypothetical protein
MAMGSEESYERPLPKRNREDIDQNRKKIDWLMKFGILVSGYMINDGANLVTDLAQFI